MTLNIIGRAAAHAVVTAVALVLVACGGGKDEPTRSTPMEQSAKKAGTPAAAAKAPAEEGNPKFATAPATSKTAAPVDLRYDLASRPAPGQDFVIELELLPRQLADRLEVDISGITGLEIVDGAAAKFEKVLPGEPYSASVTVRAEQPGVYYLDVAAKMISQVQTEARTFSVPIVVGTQAASQKSAPQEDAAGEAIEPMPATETGNGNR